MFNLRSKEFVTKSNMYIIIGPLDEEDIHILIRYHIFLNLRIFFSFQFICYLTFDNVVFYV